MPKKATVIAVVNQKGGTGKTTTCENLGVGLAMEGKKVLVVDTDPQASLTISLGHPVPDDLYPTLSDMMGKIISDQPIAPGEGILHHPEGIDLMPSNIELSGMEVSLVNTMIREKVLKQYLDTVKSNYDFILLDCMPSLGSYVHSDYLEILETAQSNSEMDMALVMMFMSMFQNMNMGTDNSTGDGALTPDGNMSLVDDYGSPTGEGKQFITVTTKTGNIFYIIIDRDDKGQETVHFLNLVDEADLMKLMDEEEAAQFTEPVEEPVVTESTEPEPTEPEVVEPEPEKKPNMLPAIILVIAMAGGGGFFLFKKFQEKQKAKEQAKPDPDADYVDEDDYGYDESEEFMDDNDEDFSEDEDNEPV